MMITDLCIRRFVNEATVLKLLLYLFFAKKTRMLIWLDVIHNSTQN